MLLHKSWLDTRSRFLIGLAVLGVAACGIVFQYPLVQKMLPTIGAMNVPDGPITTAIEDAINTSRTYRGFVWRQWFGENLTLLATLFAALLGSGSPLSGSAHGVLFSLALPVARTRWLSARAAMGLAEVFALVVGPSVAIALLSPLIGERYGVGDVVVHGLCVFVVAAVFFSLALALSTAFNDLWRPLLLTCLLAIGAGVAEQILVIDGLFAVMSAESYFLDGSVPWAGLLVSAVLTLAFLYIAAANVARRDF